MAATRAEAAEIVAGERLRIMAILESPEGLSHPATARHFALNTAMTSDQANGALANLPIESPFLEAMEREGPVGVRQSSPGASGTALPADAKEARLLEIKGSIAAYNRGRGYGA